MGAVVIVARRFVFVHMPKTGGTWLSHYLTRHAPIEWGAQLMHPVHASASVAVEKHGGARKLMFGFLRDPWGWSVSLYFFQRQLVRQGRLSGFGVSKQQQIARGAPVPTFRSVIGEIAGHYSEQLKLMFFRGNEQLCQLGRFERIREDTIAFLRAAGLSVPGGVANAIMNTAPMHTSAHARDIAGYYDDELVERVRQRDGWAFERFGLSDAPGSRGRDDL